MNRFLLENFGREKVILRRISLQDLLTFRYSLEGMLEKILTYLNTIKRVLEDYRIRVGNIEIAKVIAFLRALEASEAT